MGSNQSTCVEITFYDASYTKIKTIYLDGRENDTSCEDFEVPPNADKTHIHVTTNYSRCGLCVNTSEEWIFDGGFDIVECEVPTLERLPDFPEYSIESARLRSFDEWPKSMKQTPDELSAAGFFYTQKGDRVICFCCGGGLCQWEEQDNPWEEHALHHGECEYLQLKKGSEYVESVKEKFKSVKKDL